MQRRWMTIVAVVAMSAVMGSGCANSKTSSKENPKVKRFEGTQTGPNASGSAVELTARYTELADKAAQFQQQNLVLGEENERLKKQVDTLETQLKQTQAELTEANNLLVEMLGELNNWKSDILGFRNEMRVAAKTQLEALLKILEVLGAEAGPLPTVVEPNQHKPDAADTPTPSK
jgi:chromosome segregation ATPase